MFDLLLGLLIGLFAGGLLGMFIMACCFMARKGDEQ